jgi:predicted metalloprotease
MEFLKDALGEELYRQVEGALHGNERIKLANLADGGYVSKDKFSSESEKLKEAQRQLQERDTQLVELRESAAGNDNLQDTIRKLEDANRAQKEAMEQRLMQQARDYAIAQAVREYDPKNQKAVLAILDHEKIKVEGDAVHGLAEQMEALKQSDGYLFNLPQKASFRGVTPAESVDGVQGQAMSDEDYYSSKFK